MIPKNFGEMSHIDRLEWWWSLTEDQRISIMHDALNCIQIIDRINVYLLNISNNVERFNAACQDLKIVSDDLLKI